MADMSRRGWLRGVIAGVLGCLGVGVRVPAAQAAVPPPAPPPKPALPPFSPDLIQTTTYVYDRCKPCVCSGSDITTFVYDAARY